MSTKVVIPYTPREHFRALHQDPARHKGMVIHRRAGKSVFIINQFQRALLQNPRPDPVPRYAYVGPSFAQAKDIVWAYIKQFSRTIPGMDYSESELTATYPNGGLISLYGGSAAYERMRGLYFDGAALDEYPLLNPAAYTSVVRPALADYRGFDIVSGTSNGKDHFHKLLMKWKMRSLEGRKDYSTYDIKVTDTDALDPDEVNDMREDMSVDEFNREMMNSFEAAVEGAYYADELERCRSEGRVTGVPYDPNVPVLTCWDLGLDDETVIWYFQRVGREIHWLKCEAFTNKGLNETVPHVMSQRYRYAKDGHVFPHDIAARELTSGRSRREYLWNQQMDHTLAPRLSVEDGIQAARTLIGVSWFDKEGCEYGLSALAGYQKKRSVEHGTNSVKPLHNWASHASDAFRTGAVGMDVVLGWGASYGAGKSMHGPLRRNIRGIV